MVFFVFFGLNMVFFVFFWLEHGVFVDFVGLKMVVLLLVVSLNSLCLVFSVR